ncbi:MAG TPA: hypothetical protein VLU24_07900, partial [Mycobacterium sp.]|nr:hypothetical protein [Mycobacterium sp.]
MGKRARSKPEPAGALRTKDTPPGGAVRAWPATQRAGTLTPWLLLVAALAVLIYLNGIPGDFVFDDKLIQRDPRISGQTSFWTIFVTDYWYTYIGTSADLYRPLTIASYALNHMVAGLSSPAFHVVNIILHALASVLVVLLVDAVCAQRGLAVATGVLFATHPVHSEAVTGIVGRAEVLSALFLLLALTLQARDYTLWGAGRRWWLPVSLLAYFCALLSKETAIVGPGLVGLVDVLRQMDAPARRDPRATRWNWRRTLGVVVLYAAVAAVYLVVRFAVVGRFIQKAPPRSYLLLFDQPLLTRVFTAFEVLAIYLRLLFFPLTLSADYSYRQVPLLDAPDAVAVTGMLAALALAGGLVWVLRRRVWPLVWALGFFVVSYSVVANFPIPLQVLVAERLLYLPSVGFCVAVAWASVWLARRLAMVQHLR